MFKAIVIECTPLKDCILPFATGNYVHGFLFEQLKKFSPELAQKLHDAQGLKPFSVSPLFGDGRRVEGGVLYTAGEIYWLRFTTLSQEFNKALEDILKEIADKDFYLGENQFKVVSIKYSEHEWAGETTPEKIYHRRIIRQEDIAKKISFQIKTPAMIKRGRQEIILPEPAAFFLSIMEKWELASGIIIDRKSFADWLAQNCVVSRYQLSTRQLDFGKYKHLGFLGTIEFTDINKSTSVDRAIWNMLADFVFYCGIGAKTTMGMGMARRI